MKSSEITDFIQQLKWEDLPTVVQHQVKRCLLDIIAAAIGGRQTALSGIIHDFAALAFGGHGAQLWFDGRELSPSGAALANGMTIDALDIHDGHNLIKGHVGAAVTPAALATMSLANASISGKELLTSIVVGYEIAVRAGISLHASSCDYHTSGAWNALGATAVTARRLQLSPDKIRHALGIAEYHGPRSQMMRCIDHPTMVKDGSGWGAMAGVSAALLAASGFTGAPAVTVEDNKVKQHWDDLGTKWHILDQYFKPHAVCRWAQPAITAVLSLRQEHKFDLTTVEIIRVYTFHEAVRLAKRRPHSTEEAQYSLPFPVAASLVYNQLGPNELSGKTLRDERVLALAERIQLVEDEVYNGRFPAQRFARVEIKLTDGTELQSSEHQPGWDADQPPTDEELQQKFRWLAGEGLSAQRVTQLENMIWQLAEQESCDELANLLAFVN